VSKHYYISDFDLAPKTVKKRAERLKIERKTKSVYWSSRQLVYYTQVEFDAINGTIKYNKWDGYKCSCGIAGMPSKLYVYGIKNKCKQCMRDEEVTKRAKRKISASQKIENYFKGEL